MDGCHSPLFLLGTLKKLSKQPGISLCQESLSEGNARKETQAGVFGGDRVPTNEISQGGGGVFV